MLRAFVYLVLGWLLIALVGGLAEVLDLTVMLPATSVVVVTHAAFSPRASLPTGLAVAVALGYLEDLHQGAPIGTLTLAYATSFLALRWASARLAVPGPLMQAVVAVLALVLVDLVTAAVLLVMADALAVRRDVVVGSLAGVHWHAFATLLVAPPTWSLIERTLALLKIDDRPPRPEYETRR